jgi:hypothetical protein
LSLNLISSGLSSVYYSLRRIATADSGVKVKRK